MPQPTRRLHRPLLTLTLAAVAALSACSGGSDDNEALGSERTLKAQAALRFEVDALPLLTEGEAVNEKLAIDGGKAPFRWRLLGGRLPAGLTLDESEGAIVGNTTETGEYQIELAVTDAQGQQASTQMRIRVVGVEEPRSEPSPEQKRALARAQATNTGGDPLGLLKGLISGMPEGEWLQVSLNRFQDVWTPTAQRPRDVNGSVPSPSKIIGAWSGFAWDSNRGDLVLFGGGHANYPGNDVYRWRGSTRMWERASLPSEVTKDRLNNFTAIDGVANAPSSAHTYDNNVFLPIIDRLVVFGGAAYNNGGAFQAAPDTGTTSRKTGPYLWDPNRADGNKVGGTTGSHVTRVAPYPEVLGGQMWQNREMYINRPGGITPPSNFISGCTAYAEENGRDVVYIAASPGGGTALDLYRYQINAVGDVTGDHMSKVGGYSDGPQRQTVCGYDAARKQLVRLGSNPRPFMVWNLQNPGPTNFERTVEYVEASGSLASRIAAGLTIGKCGIDYAPSVGKHALWCGGGEVWLLTAAADGSAVGWDLTLQPTPTGTIPEPLPAAATGILGKWKFIPELGVFMALQNNNDGNIWIYKPVGWTGESGEQPNDRPHAALTAPTPGSYVFGDVIDIEAEASDSDGVVSRVDFYDGTTLIGSASAAPWRMSWTTAPIGSHVLTAVAIDDQGASGVSAPVTVTVAPAGSGSLVLQDGVNGYAGTRDAYLSNSARTRNYGNAALLYEQGAGYVNLIRFAIFQREGGPVPDNAVITSAKMSIYKSSNAYDIKLALHRLACNWVELEATWNQCNAGQAWATAGAGGSGTDYEATADATASAIWTAGWVEFDVITAVTVMRDNGVNNGWRLRRTGGDNVNLKKFTSRDSTGDASQRPKLEISYYVP